MHSLLKISKETSAARPRLRGRQERRTRHEYFIARPRLSQKHDRHSPRARLVNDGRVRGEIEPRLNEDAKVIEARLQSFTSVELLARYHDLVDLKFERDLEYTESFELARIEARLDYQDRDELEHTAAIRETWEQERGELVASLERLLAGFRAAR